MTTTAALIGTCRYGHTTRTNIAGHTKATIDCTACHADPTITAERAAFLAEHPQGIFNLSVQVKAIKARHSDTTECDGNCTHAKGDKCICACNGTNHGIGWAA